MSVSKIISYPVPSAWYISGPARGRVAPTSDQITNACAGSTGGEFGKCNFNVGEGAHKGNEKANSKKECQ